MAWTKPTNITSWSVSRYRTYTQCPLKLKLTAIDKLKEPASAAMDRGNAIHKAAEGYVRGEGRNMPADLKLFAAFFRMLRARFKKNYASMAVEETWAFKKDWSRTTWDDWNGCWLRVKLDVAWIDGDTIYVVDYKTGKFSPQYNLAEYVEQLDLYALAALIVYAGRPSLKVVPYLYYLDHNIIYPPPGEEKIYTPKDLAGLKRAWERRVEPMLADQKFAPKPNNLCKWCHFRKEGAGPCQF